MTTKYPKYEARQERRAAIALAERALGACILNTPISRSEARLLLAAIDTVNFGKRDNARLDKIAQRLKDDMARQISSRMAVIDAEFPEPTA